MHFIIQNLPAQPFQELFALDDTELARRGAKRVIANESPGFPCRVSLEDAPIGERVMLLPFDHQSEASPFRASGPIFVREGALPANPGTNEVPEMLRSRHLSVRAYDGDHAMIDAEVVDGKELESLVGRFFQEPSVAYLHVHFAGPGCYACRVNRL